MSPITREQVVDYLSALSVVDLSALTKQLEEKWGVSAAPIAVAGGAVAAAGGAAGAETAAEPTQFNVVLTDGGANKIQVIKAIREVTNLGLKEAKDLVEGAPKTVKEGVSKDEAGQIVKKLQEAGGKAEVKSA